MFARCAEDTVLRSVQSVARRLHIAMLLVKKNLKKEKRFYPVVIIHCNTAGNVKRFLRTASGVL